MGRRPVLSSRSGLTLIECLFAAAILAAGVIGIMSLVPFSIRQVGASMASTTSASVAKNALVSLGRRQLDLADYPAADYPGNITDRLFATRFRDAWANANSSRLNVGAAGTPLALYPDMPSAIFAYHVNTAAVGDGSATGAPTFKVPGLPTEQYFTAGTWSGLGIPVPVGNNPSVIPVPWASDYGWTATFLPISADDDGDGTFDEDSVDGNDNDSDGLVDEDGLIMPGTSYRVQVAVWRAYRLRCGPGATAVNGTFTDNGAAPGTVSLSAAVLDALPGDYIRLDRYGIWFKIAAISGTDVTLIGQFRHPGSLGFGAVSIASPVNLIGLYEGVIAPRSLRGSP
jgi:hypothetical protein